MLLPNWIHRVTNYPPLSLSLSLFMVWLVVFGIGKRGNVLFYKGMIYYFKCSLCYELHQFALYASGFGISKRKGGNLIIYYCGMNCINFGNILFYLVMVPYIVYCFV